jgi:hypothetical protein
VSAMNAPSMMIGMRAATFIRAELERGRGVPANLLSREVREEPARASPDNASSAVSAAEAGGGERASWPA